MVDALAKGDESSAGACLVVSRLGDSYLGVEGSNGVEVQIQRTAVVQVLPPSSGPTCLAPSLGKSAHEPLPHLEIRAVLPLRWSVCSTAPNLPARPAVAIGRHGTVDRRPGGSASRSRTAGVTPGRRDQHSTVPVEQERLLLARGRRPSTRSERMGPDLSRPALVVARGPARCRPGWCRGNAEGDQSGPSCWGSRHAGRPS